MHSFISWVETVLSYLLIASALVGNGLDAINAVYPLF